MKPKLTAVLIAACACTASVAGGDGDASPPSCVPRAGEADWWAPKHEAQFAAAKDRGEAIKVAVLGDSLAAFWTAEGKKAWQEQWVPRGAACFGIPADRTEHVLWRIGQGLFAKKEETRMFNGYADEVASLYAGMDLIEHH